MDPETHPFDHDFTPGAITFGRGCIADLGTSLSASGLDRALVVCGSNVGTNRDLMGPVEDGLGDRLVGVFDRTTPEKSVETAADGVDVLREHDADALVAVGGGSSLDTAKMMSVLHARDCSLDEVRREVTATGGFAVPSDPEGLVPLIAVPTTFAGADLSYGAGSIVPMDGGTTEIVISGDHLMPQALFYDPAVFETTPMSVLTGSAINGFDKALEAIYSRLSNPLTDATAVRGLKYLGSSLPLLRETDDPAVMERAVVGIVLAQYGISDPEESKINVVHAFGQGLRNQFGIQQGVAHAVVVPHALRLLFESVDARREVLAEGLVTGDPEDVGEAVVEAVEAIRDGLGLPSRLRDVDAREDEIPEAAQLVFGNDILDRGPEAFDPSLEQIEATLYDAW